MCCRYVVSIHVCERVLVPVCMFRGQGGDLGVLLHCFLTHCFEMESFFEPGDRLAGQKAPGSLQSPPIPSPCAGVTGIHTTCLTFYMESEDLN